MLDEKGNGCRVQLQKMTAKGKKGDTGLETEGKGAADKKKGKS